MLFGTFFLDLSFLFCLLFESVIFVSFCTSFSVVLLKFITMCLFPFFYFICVALFKFTESVIVAAPYLPGLRILPASVPPLPLSRDACHPAYLRCVPSVTSPRAAASTFLPAFSANLRHLNKGADCVYLDAAPCCYLAHPSQAAARVK